MERILSQEERIRRAEEIYYRRKLNNGDIRMPSSQVRDKTEKRQFSLYRKMAIQILICILIYLIFSLIKEANYLFSENIINKTKEFLNTDINFTIISSNINEFWKNNKDKFKIFTNNEETNLENTNNEQTTQNTQQNNTATENTTQTNTNAVENNTNTNVNKVSNNT